MTTIVIDIKNSKIYSDTQATTNIKDNIRKVYNINGSYFCISGDVYDCFEFIDCFVKGGKKSFKNKNFEVLEIDKDKNIYKYNQYSYNKVFCLQNNKDFIAIGCGSIFVNAIYQYNIENNIKIDFEKIIKAVSKIDPCTNESIEIFKF